MCLRQGCEQRTTINKVCDKNDLTENLLYPLVNFCTETSMISNIMDDFQYHTISGAAIDQVKSLTYY